MSTPDYKTIFSSVRPHRVAVLVDRNDPDWHEACLRVIEYYSTAWGGGYNIIVPTDGKTIDEKFWKLLEVFDPDQIGIYLGTARDIKLAKPAE